ncbi:hypothetical protein ACIBED_20635 [Rhodococcus coprophilus]|uniref:hypothetical protein n=1 Tax=Rhodococcus coprophilus TaxID=38310 RepID=UPI00378C217D
MGRVDEAGIGPAVGGIADVVHAEPGLREPIDLDESSDDVVEDDEVEQRLPVGVAPSILEPVVEPGFPVPAPPTEPIPAVEVTEVATPESAPTSLSDAIIEVLASDRLQVSRIAARVKEDYKVVQSELDRLMEAGRVARVKGLNTLALYHVVDEDERVEDLVQQAVVVESEVRPIPIEAAVPSQSIGPLVEEPESEPDVRPLADSILEILAREPPTFSELTARIDARWMDVHAELGRLVVEGRLREVTPAKGLTEFHVVDALGDFGTVDPPRTEEHPQPEATVPEPRAQVPVVGGWETLPPEAIDSLPPSLGSRIVEQLSNGPVALSDLEFRLDEPRTASKRWSRR